MECHRRRKTNNLDNAFEFAYSSLSKCDLPDVASFNVNMTDSKGQTLVHRAVAEGNTSALRVLAKAGCDVNATYGNKEIPLLVAIRRIDVEMVQALVDAKAEVNIVCSKCDMLAWSINLYLFYFIKTEDDRDYSLSCILANCRSYISIMTVLLKAGADPNTKHVRGCLYTPLQFLLKQVLATHVFPHKVCSLLLQSGADPDAIASKNWLVSAPIIIAVESANLAAVRLLLQYNCCLNWTDTDTGDKCSPIPEKFSFQYDFTSYMKVFFLLHAYGCDLTPGLPQLNLLFSQLDIDEKQLSEWLEFKKFVCSPFRLRTLAMKAVRSRLSHHLETDVKHLNLPVVLQNYIAALK